MYMTAERETKMHSGLNSVILTYMGFVVTSMKYS